MGSPLSFISLLLFSSSTSRLPIIIMIIHHHQLPTTSHHSFTLWLWLHTQESFWLFMSHCTYNRKGVLCVKVSCLKEIGSAFVCWWFWLVWDWAVVLKFQSIHNHFVSSLIVPLFFINLLNLNSINCELRFGQNENFDETSLRATTKSPTLLINNPHLHRHPHHNYSQSIPNYTCGHKCWQSIIAFSSLLMHYSQRQIQNIANPSGVFGHYRVRQVQGRGREAGMKGEERCRFLYTHIHWLLHVIGLYISTIVLNAVLQALG